MVVGSDLKQPWFKHETGTACCGPQLACGLAGTIKLLEKYIQNMQRLGTALAMIPENVYALRRNQLFCRIFAIPAILISVGIGSVLTVRFLG
jgi:hypothetical protein